MTGYYKEYNEKMPKQTEETENKIPMTLKETLEIEFAKATQNQNWRKADEIGKLLLRTKWNEQAEEAKQATNEKKKYYKKLKEKSKQKKIKIQSYGQALRGLTYIGQRKEGQIKKQFKKKPKQQKSKFGISKMLTNIFQRRNQA